jgi:YrbI family 3-deoxy-D-manno-octulosonate 8-phosphate phosphatase
MENLSPVVAVIPARAGSKGIPDKNLRRVGGVPLVSRAVLSALRARLVDRVVVTTDGAEIAEAARIAGAEVVERPGELAGDTASSESALLHALDTLGIDDGVLVFVQATAPFIAPADLDDAVRRVLDHESDVVFSAIEAREFLWGESETSAYGINHDAAFRLRRQDREKQYRETGAFYVMDIAGFRAARHRFFGRVGLGMIDERHAIEIDTLAELDVAGSLANVLDAHEPIDVDAVVTDFDGVHTDDRVIVGEDGRESVTVNRRDGMGVRMLREAGVPFLIISTEANPVVSARARKLRVEVAQGVDDKAAVLADWAAGRGIPLERIAFLGNDVNDLGAFAVVGWPIAVGDAHPAAIAAARHTLTAPGGGGAVRELAELVLQGREAITWQSKSDSPRSAPTSPSMSSARSGSTTTAMWTSPSD